MRAVNLDSKFAKHFVRLDKGYTAFSNVMSHISAVCLCVAMLLASIDIILAKFFHSGIPGQYEMIQMLSVPMLYLTLSYTQLSRDQIKMTLFLNKVPAVVREAIIYIGYAAGAAMGLFMAYQSGRYMVKLFSQGVMTTGRLHLKQWPFCACLVLGCTCLAIAYVFTIIRRAIGYNPNPVPEEEEAPQADAIEGGGEI